MSDVDEGSAAMLCSPLSLLAGRGQANDRGFEIIEFKDAYGADCELQQSSAIGDTSGWKKPGSSFVWLGARNARIHLSRLHVLELVRVLLGWLDSGSLRTPVASPAWTFVGDTLPPVGVNVLVSDGERADVASLAWGDEEDVRNQEWHDTPLVPSHWMPIATLPEREDV